MSASALRAIREEAARIGSSLSGEHFWRQTLVLLVALGLLNGSNYVFHIVVSRMLGPSEYGALAALLAVLMVLSVPFGVLHTVVAQRAASLRATDRDSEADNLAASMLKTLTPFAWAAGLITLVVATPVLAKFLDVGAGAAALLAPYVLLSVLNGVPTGVLQGEFRFGAMAGLIVTGVILRLAFAVTFVGAGLGVAGALLATPAAAAVTLPLGLRLVGVTRRSWRSATRTLAPLRGDFQTALFALTSFWLLAEIDIAFARHYLSHAEAGFYSSAGLLTRALLIVPAAVSVVAFPRFVTARERGGDPRRLVRLSLVTVAALMACVTPILLLLREPLVALAFGDEFRPAAALVPLLTLAMVLLSVVSVLVYFHIAVGSRSYAVIFGAVGAEAALITVFHSTPEQIATVVVVVAAVAALAQYETARSVCRWRPALEQVGRERVAEAAVFAGPPSLEFSLVLPCHNAGGGLRTVLDGLCEELRDVESYEIIVVSDGSTDDTVSVADEFRARGVRVLESPARGGKGHALRCGLSEARGRYVAFFDADGDIGPEAISSFLALMNLYEPDIVLGSKRHPLSVVNYPPLRRGLSWTYHKLTRLLFRVNVRDTQTGLKLIRRDVLAAVLPRLLEKRYAFDLEFLVVARGLGYTRVLEAPVRIDYKFASQVDPRAAIRIGIDTLAIFYRHYVLNTYRQAGRRPEPSVLAPAVPVPPREELVADPAGGHRSVARPLRILFLSARDVRNGQADDADVLVQALATRWSELGHDVTILASRFRGARRSEVVEGVQVRRVGRLRSGAFHLLARRELARERGYDLIVDSVGESLVLAPLRHDRATATVALLCGREEQSRGRTFLDRGAEPRLLRTYGALPVIASSDEAGAELRALGFESVLVLPQSGAPAGGDGDQVTSNGDSASTAPDAGWVKAADEVLRAIQERSTRHWGASDELVPNAPGG